MKGKLYLYYDEEADFLEIHVGPFRSGHFRNLGKGVFERVNDKTKEVTGIAIQGFRKKTQKQKECNVSLPVEIELFS